MTVLYNNNGRPVAYIENGENIYLFDGSPVAFLNNESIYSYSGNHLGWMLDGWVIDHDGRHVFFTQNASGGPALPARQALPARSAREARPARGAREPRPPRPAREIAWSDLSSEEFFEQ